MSISQSNLLRQDHIVRPIDWRWRRAQFLRKHGKFLDKSRDDEWILQAATFQEYGRRAKTPDDFTELWDSFPYISQAIELRDRLRGKPTPPFVRSMRYELEARLLSGDSIEQIAVRLHLDKEIVETFEQLFFNVLDRLDCESYIFHIAIGPAIYRGLDTQEFGTIWKLFAYLFGSKVLDYLLRTTSDFNRPTTFETAVECLKRELDATTLQKMVLSSRLLSLSEGAPLALIQLHKRLQPTVVHDPSAERLREGVAALIKAFPPTRRQKPLAPNLTGEPRLEDYRAEPRADEQLDWTINGILPKEKDSKYPE